MFPAIVDAPNARFGRDVPKDALGRRVVAAAPLGELCPHRPPDVMQGPIGDAAHFVEVALVSSPRRERATGGVREIIV